MSKITGSVSPKEILDIKIAWAKKHDHNCPHCGKSVKEFGIQVRGRGDLFYCKKCKKYHNL